MNKIKVYNICHRSGICCVRLSASIPVEEMADRLFRALGEKRVQVQLLVQCTKRTKAHHFALCIDQKDVSACREILANLKDVVEPRGVEVISDAGLVWIYGPHFDERPAVAGTMFSALASRGIEILAISVSVNSAFCLVPAKKLEAAAAALSEVFVIPKGG